MKLTWNELKRLQTLQRRKLDFADAAKLFEGRTATIVDDRQDYGETRFITAGVLNDRVVVIVWTSRGTARRIISMRYCHDKEEKLWRKEMER